MLASTPNLLQMCSFDATKSTKGASKLRRDLINAEIANLRDLLPLPSSTRQRLSQLQLMALVCVYVRKANYFQHAFRKHDLTPEVPMPHFGFSKALNGFLMMMTQNGKLLYISDNAAEYLGHSMEDLLIHGDSVYDIIEKQDHQTIQAELIRSSNPLSLTPDKRLFLCRMNVSRNARRQMRFGDQKVVLVEGHFVSFLPLCSRNEPVFLATCTPVAMPETRECVVQGSTNVFTSIHSMDMKYLHIDRNGEFHLGHTKGNIQGMSWYDLVHWDNLREAQSKHRLITQSEQERSCILLLRLKTNANQWIWVHIVLQVKDSNDTSQQPVIVCTNQVLSEKEALVMRANSWLYQFYSLHSKMHYSLAYDAHTSRLPGYYPPAAPASAVMAHSYHHPTGVTAGPETANVPLHPVQPLSPYSHIHTAIAPLNGTPNHHHPHHPTPVLQYSPQAGSLPYSSFVPVNASPIAESECNRQANQTAKRTLTPPHHDHQEEQPQQDEETETTEPNTKRPNHGHHLPPPPSSTYHHPRASSFGYPTSMFGAGGFSSISGVTELGTVVPVSGYYSGHQMLTSVPYHHQIGHHFRNQNKLSLFDHDGDSGELEQSLTPTNTEEVSNMISMTASSPPSFFKYPPSSITLANQYYSVAGQYLDVEKHTSKSPQSITSDYGSGTSSPPSAFEKPKKDGTDYGDHFIVSGSGGIQQQMYQTLRSWNNYPIYTDLSSSKPMRGSPVHQFRGRDGDTNSLRVCSDNTTSHLGGSNHRLVYSNGDHTVGFNDNSGISHLVSSQANPVIAMPLTAAMSETLSPPLSIAQLSVTGTPVQASSRSPSSSSEAGDPNPSSCGVGRAPGYDGGGGGVGGATAAGTRRGASSKRSQDRNEEQTSRSQNSCNSE